MKTTQILKLDRVSPADREEKRLATLLDIRNRNSKRRADARTVGIVPITIDVPQTMIDELDTIKRHAGLRSRSQAFAHLMTMLGAYPQLKQELGL